MAGAGAWLRRKGVLQGGIHKVAHRPCRPLLYSCGILPFGHAGTTHVPDSEAKPEQARQDGINADTSSEDRQAESRYRCAG
jgi:hypothetical protein